MSTETKTISTDLATICRYRDRGVMCDDGNLYDSVTHEPMLLEGTGVYCPACEGKGMLITSKGRELLNFFERFARPQLRDILDQLLEERER